MTRNLVCSECGGSMQSGFIVETISPRDEEASYWVEGKPETNFLGTLKITGKRNFDIIAYRCERCGFLKFYAGPDVTTKN